MLKRVCALTENWGGDNNGCGEMLSTELNPQIRPYLLLAIQHKWCTTHTHTDTGKDQLDHSARDTKSVFDQYYYYSSFLRLIKSNETQTAQFLRAPQFFSIISDASCAIKKRNLRYISLRIVEVCIRQYKNSTHTHCACILVVLQYIYVYMGAAR